MRKRIASTVGVAALAFGAVAAYPAPAPLPQPAAAAELPAVSLTPRHHTTRHTVAEGDTAGSILRGLGAPDGVLAAAGNRLDRLSIGDELLLDFRDGDAEPWRLRLRHGTASLVEIERTGQKWRAGSRPVPWQIADGVRKMVVESGSSLWEAATSAGMGEDQIGALAKIYEYDVDFNTEIQPGATFRMVAETLTAEDGTQRVGDIRAAELKNGGKTYMAIRFRLADGSVGWFAPDGTGRRRPFLRSPLAFSRVTSGFNLKRFHPVLKKARPHLGTDFGAPTGTPVRAVADGTVTTAGKHGGHGNFVELDHTGPYSTSYSHLSAISVKRGQKVKQGDIIGKVGSTGLSTGPHLHYQFMVNGNHVNPMSIELPMTGTLPDAEKPAFFAVRDAVLPLLAEAPPKAN